MGDLYNTGIGITTNTHSNRTVSSESGNALTRLRESHYDLSANHDALKSTVSDLSASHYDLSANHDALKTTVSDLSASHYDLSANHRALKVVVSDLSASHNDLSANHRALKVVVSDLSASHYDLSGNHRALKSTVSDLSASHYDLSANHRALKSTVSDLSASHYDLSANHLVLKNNVNDLTASHYDLSGNHRALKSTVSDLSASHYDLSGNHRALKSTVSDLSTNNNIRFNNIDTSLSQVYTKTQSDSIFVSKSNIDLSNLSTNIIPSTDNTYKIGDVSKNWRNAYIKDISVTNIDIANNLTVFGQTQLNNTLNVNGNVTLNGPTLYAPSAFTIDPYGHDNNTGTVFINGNLTVQGLTTTINSTTIDISDKTILLASNAKNSIEATGAGFEISGANVNFIYDYPSSAFRSSIGLSISGNVVPANSTNVNLGVSGNIWKIAYIDELNVNSFTNSINGANITSETITSTQIMNRTILGIDISAATIEGFNIASGTITSSNIADGTITFLDIAQGTIRGYNIEVGTITTDKIADRTILGTDISTATIQGSNIATGTITTDNIADGTIVNSDISANAAIAFSKINTTNAITNSDISNSAAIAFSKINASFAIMDSDISSNANIQGSKIASETITSTQIANGSILGTDISNDTITSANIRDGSILTADICDNAITFDKLAHNSVTNIIIANGAVTHAKLSSNCVQSHNIANGTIVDDDISANANISGSKLANNSITSDKIDKSNNWTFSQLTSNTAYIRDISASNISISGNIIPLDNSSSDLGSGTKRWRNIYVNDLSVSTINGQVYSTTPAINLTSVSGNIIPSLNNTFRLGDTSRNWSNAYINDISASNISISGNILPLDNSSSDLGSSLKRWRNIYVNDLSVTRINGFVYSAGGGGTAIDLTSVSGNIIPSLNNTFRLGDTSRNWSNAYINDISASNIEISGNILPLRDISSDLGSSLKRWRNIYVNDLSVTRINGFVYSAGGGGTAIDLTSVSGNIIPSSNVNFRLGDTSRNWSNAYIRDISATNISISGNIIFSISGGSMRIAADASTNSITSTRRIYQNISGGINDPSWASVNGYYALAKDAYPGLNSYSSLAKTSTWRGVTITNPSILTTYWSSTAWSPSLGLFVCVGSKGTGTTTVMTSRDGINWNPITIANSNITDSYWNVVCWSPELNIFVAGSMHGPSPVRFMTSNNGVNWTPASYYIGVPVFEIVWSSQLGIFVALMYTSWLRILTSTDGSNWTERPLPTSPQNLMNSNLEALCWSPELGLFVAVATDGVRAISSKNGINWSSCNVPASCVDVQWVGITWSGQLGIFVSVARAGGPAGSPRIMTSYDGINWTARGLNNEKWLDVCWSAELELFVIVTDNDSISSRIKTSRDGINWTLASSGPPLISNYLNRVIWCPELGIFLANGSGNFIITISSLKARPPTSYNVFGSSFNSIDENGNWTFQNITTTSRIYQNISGGINDPSWASVNGYYALAKHAYPALNPLSSGVKAVQTWTSRALPTSTVWRSVCWSPERGMFVAVGGSKVVYSFDGLIWSDQTTGVPSNGWISVCWSPQLTRFVAVASSGTNKVMYSSNGINWSSVLLTNSVSWADVCWSPQLGLFVAVGTTTTNRVMYSYDGSSNWTQPAVAVPLSGGAIAICWSPELKLFVVVSDGDSGVFISSNGINWTTTLDYPSAYYIGVCWSPHLGLFVAVSYGGQVMISSNGINWSQVSVPYATWGNVSWCADIGLFIAVAGDGGANRLMYSPNGINWTSVFIQQLSWESVCWSPELGVAVIVGRNGGGAINTVLTSSLKGRPPTSTNVFDSSFNSIDQSGNWTFSAIDISTNLNPSTPLTGSVGTTAKPWGNAVIRDLSVSTINGQAYSAGGGGLTANSINSSHIIDGTIVGTDISSATIQGSNIANGTITSSNIANGTILGMDIANLTITGANIVDETITQSKLAAAFLLRIHNLEYPGFYGSLRIQNSNSSAAGTSITFTLQSTNISGVLNLLGSTTLTPNQHIDVPILIQNRLLNKDTSFNIVYSSASTTITPSIQTGVSVTTPIVSPNIYFSVLPAYIHNGTIQVSLTLAAPPPPVGPTITYTGTYDTGNWPNRVFNDTNTAPYGAPAGIYFSAEANMPLPLNLTFPAGATRVRLVTSPSVNWLSNLPDFIPTAGQTSANITINKVSPGLYDSQTTLQLLLNTNTNSSYNFLVTAHYEL